MRNKIYKGTHKSPGIFQIKPGLFRLSARRKDPRRVGKGRAREQLFEGTYQDAKRARAQLVLQLETAVEELEARAKQSLNDAMLSWLALKAPVVSAATARGYRDAIVHHLAPALGNIFVDKVNRHDVQRMVNKLIEKGLAHDTIKGKTRVFRTFWWWLMLDDETLRDVTKGVDVGTEKLADPDNTNTLAPGEIQRFLQAWTGHRDEALINLLFWGGQRWCHTSALLWEDLDVGGLSVKMMRSQTRGVVTKANRNKRTPGYVFLPEHVVALLVAHRERLMRDSVPNPLGLMFPSAVGTYRTPNSVFKSWRKAVVRASIKRPFSVHGLRNTKNNLTRQVSDETTTRAMIGHVSQQMTAHYSHVDEAQKVATQAKVFAMISGVQS